VLIKPTDISFVKAFYKFLQLAFVEATEAVVGHGETAGVRLDKKGGK
jgi:hypothetical protein